MQDFKAVQLAALTRFKYMVTNLADADKRITVAKKSRAPIPWVLSITDPDTEFPDDLFDGGVSNPLHLGFDDTDFANPSLSGKSWKGRDIVPPSKADMARIIQFCEQINKEGQDGDLILIHCHAGISRSTASMYTLLNVLTGAGCEAELLNYLYEIRPEACPNSLMVEYADALLNRKGAMYRALVANDCGPGVMSYSYGWTKAGQ